MQRRLNIIYFLIFVTLSGQAFAKNMLIQLSEGRSVVAYLEKNSAEAPWLVFLPGSGCGLYYVDSNSWMGTVAGAVAHKYPGRNLLVINKAGIQLDGSCNKTEYTRASVRGARIADVIEVMNRTLPPHAKVIMVGESEGACIVPDFTQLDARVRAMVLFSISTRSWLEEEVSFVSSDKRTALWDFFNKEVIPNPVLDKFYRGWSYAQLVSYHNQSGLHALRDSHIPILMLNGARDNLTFVQGTAEDARWLLDAERKINIEFHLVPGGNHGLHCENPNVCSEQEVQQLIGPAIDHFVSSSF